MSYTQRTPQRKRRQQPPPPLRIEVRPLLVEGRQRKRRSTRVPAPPLASTPRQRRRRRTHLSAWLAAFGLVALALVTTGAAYALGGHPGGIRQASVDLAAVSPSPSRSAARHTAAMHTAARAHAVSPTHTTARHPVATHTAARTHAVSSTHTAASTHAVSSTHTAARPHSTTNRSVALLDPVVPVTSTPDTSSTTSAQTDVAPLSTDMSTSEMALAAAAASQSFTPPAYLIADYRALAKRYGLTWQVLAALSYAQEDGYSDALAGEQASQVATAARDAQGSHGANVNVIAQAAAAAASPNPTLVDDAVKLAAAGGDTSPGAALKSLTGSATTAQEVLTVAQAITALSPQSDTALADSAAGAQATAASSSSKAYADVPTSAVTSTTAPTGAAEQQLTAMLTEAHLLNELPYVWGGGHDDPAWLVTSGYDCSGFVSAVLHAAGYLSGPDTTQTLPDSAGILSGPGKYVTIYDRTINTMNFAKPKKKAATSAAMTLKQETLGVHMTGRASKHSVSIGISPAVQRAIEAAAIAKGNAADNTINDEHVIIDLDGQWWESGGDASDGGAEMVHQISNISQSYLKSFNLVLHPAGL